MDANILALIITVLGSAFALPGAVLSMILLRDRISQQHKGNNRELKNLDHLRRFYLSK